MVVYYFLLVNYQQGQEAYLLYSGVYNDYFPNGISSDHVLITLSPDSFTVAIAHGKSFIMVDAQTQEKSDVFQDVHGGKIIENALTAFTNNPSCSRILFMTNYGTWKQLI